MAILSVWEFTDNAILDDLKGNYKLNVYIQGGQEDNIKDATLSHNHRTGSEKRLYWSNGVFADTKCWGEPFRLLFITKKCSDGTWNTEDREI